MRLESRDEEIIQAITAVTPLIRHKEAIEAEVELLLATESLKPFASDRVSQIFNGAQQGFGLDEDPLKRMSVITSDCGSGTTVQCEPLRSRTESPWSSTFFKSVIIAVAGSIIAGIVGINYFAWRRNNILDRNTPYERGAISTNKKSLPGGGESSGVSIELVARGENSSEILTHINDIKRVLDQLRTAKADTEKALSSSLRVKTELEATRDNLLLAIELKPFVLKASGRWTNALTSIACSIDMLGRAFQTLAQSSARGKIIVVDGFDPEQGGMDFAVYTSGRGRDRSDPVFCGTKAISLDEDSVSNRPGDVSMTRTSTGRTERGQVETRKAQSLVNSVVSSWKSAIQEVNVPSSSTNPVKGQDRLEGRLSNESATRYFGSPAEMPSGRSK